MALRITKYQARDIVPPACVNFDIGILVVNPLTVFSKDRGQIIIHSLPEKAATIHPR